MKPKLRKMFIILSICMLLAVIVSVVGIITYNSNKDSINGTFFRHLHGSVGIIGENEYYICFTLFCFNCGPDFLESESCLGFDNQNVLIKHVSFTEQTKDNDLTVYNVSFGIVIENPGQHEITKLKHFSDNGTEEYPIGRLAFVRQDGKCLDLFYGMDTRIMESTARFTFSHENTVPFSIDDIIVANNPEITYLYDKRIGFIPDEDLIYCIKIEYDISGQDLFLFQPIFKISSVNDEYNGYFAPNMVVYGGDNLSYMEIKEYVK